MFCNYVHITIDDTVVLRMYIKSCVIIIYNIQCTCVHVYLLSLLMCAMYSLNVCYGLCGSVFCMDRLFLVTLFIYTKI